MLRNKLIIIPVILLTFSWSLKAQEQSKCSFNGYLSGMPQHAWTNITLDTLSTFEKFEQYNLHNRMNFFWYPTDKISGTIQFRNQIMYGDFTKDLTIENGFVTENYFLPLTYQKTFGDAGLVSISTDRAWLQYSHNSIDVKMGRQRINWGQTFVWNPNDIFNAYNFFDFDYAERPGVDAARFQYYPNYTSTIDLAVKIDSGSNVTAAGLYRVNKWSSDIQFIGGYYSQPSAKATLADQNESDWVGGMGITSDYKGVSIRTEATYLIPTTESLNQNNLFLWSIGLDYMLKNELYLSGEFFYSSRVDLALGSNILDPSAAPLTVKNLAYAKYNGFAQASYPFTPLFKVTVSGMFFTDNKMTGYFLGPYLDYSIMDNLDLALYFQFFKYNYKLFNSELESQTSFAFLRLKWSF